MGVVMLLGQGVLVGVALQKLKEEKTVIIGLALSCLGLLAVLAAPDFAILLISACVIGVGSGLVMPSISSYISNRTDKDTQGSALGVMGSYNSLGRIVGPPVGGFAYDVNMIFPYVSSAILLALGALSVVFIMWSGKREEMEKAVVEPPV
jgi:MFS family permease